MKRLLSVIVASALLCGTLTACGDLGDADTIKIGNSTFGGDSETSETTTVQTEKASKEETTAAREDGNSDVSTGEILDLRELSPTVVYSEVYAMMNEPESYEGKTIIAKGPFAHYDDERTGQQYYAVIIKDATACCAQGIEFVLYGDKKYPDDYPDDGEEITVTGRFNTYEDVTGKYVQLVDAEILD